MGISCRPQPANETVSHGGTATQPPIPFWTGAVGPNGWMYVFVHWYYDDENTAFDFSTPITQNKTLTARWAEDVPPFIIAFSADGSGTISATADGISIVSIYLASPGADIEFTALPSPGASVFAWSVNGVTTISSQLSLSINDVNSGYTVIVIFEETTHNFTINDALGVIFGNVSDGTTVEPNRATPVMPGVNVTIPPPPPGFRLIGLTHDGIPIPAILPLTIANINEDHVIDVVLEHYASPLVFEAVPDARGSVTGTAGDGAGGTFSIVSGGVVQHGEAVTLTAVPAAGSIFVGWEVIAGGITIANPNLPTISFTMPSETIWVIANFIADPNTQDIVIVVDTSQSMQGAPMVAMRNELPGLIRGLMDEGHNVMAVRFSSDASAMSGVLGNFTTTATDAQIIQSVNRLSAGGGTNTQAGLQLAASRLNARNSGNARRIILLSDGLPNAGPLSETGLFSGFVGAVDSRFWQSANALEEFVRQQLWSSMIVDVVGFLQGAQSSPEFAREVLNSLRSPDAILPPVALTLAVSASADMSAASEANISEASGRGGRYFLLSEPSDLGFVFAELANHINGASLPSPNLQVEVYGPVAATIEHGGRVLSGDMRRPGGFINVAPWGRIDFARYPNRTMTIPLSERGPFEIEMRVEQTGVVGFAIEYFGRNEVVQRFAIDDISVAQGEVINTTTDNSSDIILYQTHLDGSVTRIVVPMEFYSPDEEDDEDDYYDYENGDEDCEAGNNDDNDDENNDNDDNDDNNDNNDDDSKNNDNDDDSKHDDDDGRYEYSYGKEALPELELTASPSHWRFITAQPGYDNDEMSRTFTIRNTGANPITNLTASLIGSLPGRSYFEIISGLSATEVSPGQTVSIRVRPIEGLGKNLAESESIYYDFVNRLYIQGSDGFYLTIALRFKVTEGSIASAIIDPERRTFAAARPGYNNANMEQIFTIVNTGTVPITDLEASLSGAYFEISSPLEEKFIATGNSLTVGIRPRSGLNARTYTDTLTITGSYDIILTAELNFTVSTRQTWRAEVSAGEIIFATAPAGYSNVDMARELVIRNIGTERITGLSARLGSSGFEIISGLPDTLDSGAYAVISVVPREGLSAGRHSGTLQITGNNGIRVTVRLSFTVSDILFGDLNGDGYVDDSDLVLMLSFFARPGVEIDRAAADVNADGVLSIADLILMLRYFAEQPGVFLGP